MESDELFDYLPAAPVSASERIPLEWLARAQMLVSGYGNAEEDDAQLDAFVAQFEARWGALTLEALVRAAHHYADVNPDAGTNSDTETASDVRMAPTTFGAHPAGQEREPGARMSVSEAVLWQMAPFREVVDGHTLAIAYEAIMALTALGLILAKRERDQVTTSGRDALARYLSSPSPRARWTSTLWLGRLGDARAVPNLVRMLTEFLPPHAIRYADNTHGDPEDFYEDMRQTVLPLIWHVGGEAPAGLAGALRQALLGAVAAEEALQHPQGPEQKYFVWDTWYTGEEALQMDLSFRAPWMKYQHQLVYGLGRLGAFGALMGVLLPPGAYNASAPWTSRFDDPYPDHRELDVHAEAEGHAARMRGYVWRVQACCGYLEAEYCERLNTPVSSFAMVTFAMVLELARAVAGLLEERFGLTEAERRAAMEEYVEGGYLIQITHWYERVARKRAEQA